MDIDTANVFKYHPPKDGQQRRYETLRERGEDFADMIDGFCPDSKEKEIAVQKLREVVMWANASIACNE